MENDIRVDLLNSILTCPHKDFDKINGIHQNMVEQDPIFYTRLAAWYSDKGDVRDHNTAFTANLCSSSYSPGRTVGLALLRQMPPYLVERVVDLVKQGKKHNVPRSMRTEVEKYLREREEKEEWFDSSVVNARKNLKGLYAKLRISPSERAQQVLFDDSPPEGSLLHTLKVIAKEENPTEQARLIIENQIPYRIASSIVKNMTPTVVLALVESMSDQELINNMGSLKKHGVFDNPDLKELIKSRLDSIKKSKKVAALKSLEAVKNTDLDEDIKEKLVDVADTQIKAKGRITRPTALFIDKSSSMNQSIEIGKQLAAMISTCVEADFFCYVFDSAPYKVSDEGNARGKDIGEWTKAFEGVRAQGTTCCSAPLVAMTQLNEKVDQIVMITDEGENQSPTFMKALRTYSEKIGSTPSVLIIRCGNRGSWGKISEPLIRNGFDVEVYEFNGDYYSLPNMIHFLTKPSKLDLLIEIMNYTLPERKQ